MFGSFLALILIVLGVTASVAFPQTPLDVTIEIYYDSAWNDITQYVYHRDAAPITITRGRANEGRACDPGKLNLQLNNRDGRFSPRNPTSPLYRKIGRNTPIRVKVTESAVTYTRFVGEVTSWPSRWDVSGRDVWVPIEAAGILRRLGQAEKPVRSALYRAMAGVAPGDYLPHAYWPMEDGSAASQFASAIAGGQPVIPAGSVEFGADATLVGSDALPVFGANASATFPIPTYTDTGQWMVQFPMLIPTDPGGSRTYARVKTTGVAARIDLDIDFSSFIDIHLRSYDSSGSLIVDTTFPKAILDDDFYGQWFMYTIAWTNDVSAPYTNNLTWVDASSASYPTVAIAGNLVGSTDGIATSVILMAPTADVGFGHVGFFKEPTSGTPSLIALELEQAAQNNVNAMFGNDGDTVEDRFARICDQHVIPYEIVGSAEARIGPERTVTVLDCVRDAEAVDQGFIFERRDALGLVLRTNSSRYQQAPLALDYDVGHISPPFDPEPDDQNVVNDREVKRRNGSSARRELASGPLSVQDPPDGVGRYDDSITVDAYSDGQLDNLASWRLNIGTQDAERYPRVRIDLSANPALIPDVAALDSGDAISISNLPAWLPPDDAELIVEGYREVIAFYDWDFIFNCSPGGIYQQVGRWDTVASELVTAVNSSATSFDVATTDGPLWTTDQAPFDWAIAGERVTVSSIAASTATYGAVGTVAHANNASVSPSLPGSLAQGNLMLMVAAIRNSGTGVPNTPSGWTRLPIFGSSDNVQLFAKIAGASESAPTVTFTGGVANADTSAQIIRLAGKWHDVANILLGGKSYLNASAQDITVPSLSKPVADNAIIIYFGWKQDDWTSVASPGTEIAEEDTTTGDDQGIVWAYTIQTTAAAIAATSFVVTGGSTAISRGAVIALCCDYQTATVIRSVNGVSKSQSAGESISLWTPARWGL